MKMMNFLTKFVFLGLLCTINAQRGQRQARQCYTPDNYLGLCVTLSNCASLANLYAQNGGSQQVIQYLVGLQRNCGQRNIRGDPVVCCVDSYRNPNQPQPQPQTPATTPFRQPSFPPPTSTPPQRPPAIVTRDTSCTGPDGVRGSCVGLKSCPTLLARLQENQSDAAFVKFLRQSNVICGQPSPIVCCPSATAGPIVVKPSTGGSTANVVTLPTINDGCGISNNTFQKVVGGQAAKLGAWPWIALLGYTDSFGASTFKCGGVLVTQRHVMTAAHCIRTDLKFVRLGEHDLNTEGETSYADINVVKMVRHPAYSTRDGHSDIAMLRLSNAAPFTSLIRPACLPVSPALRAKSYVNFQPFVAGWGKTVEGGKSANVLQQIQIPVHTNAVCQNAYQKQNRVISTKQFDQAVLCAGVLSGGVDTCQGDSGGPLMIPETVRPTDVRYFVIGIVSYGIGCARPQIPGIYSSVANFMDWVEQQVADTS